LALTLGIVCALRGEARTLSRQATSAAAARLSDGSLLVVCGMGQDAATDGARKLLDGGAQALVSWGVAGGLDPGLTAGTLVLPERTGDGQESYATQLQWRACLASWLSGELPVSGGYLLSLPLILTAPDKARWFRQTGGVAVDMESLAIARQANAAAVPFMAVRAIVDESSEELPPAALRGIDSAGQLRTVALLRELLRAPGQVPALLRLAASYRAAHRALRAIAARDTLARCIGGAAHHSPSA
jgi:adenosylhomocysteine nucleosidase